MNYIISGKNIEVTEGLRNAVQDKLSKLEKYFAADTGAQVTFSVEKDRQKIEVTIPMKGHIIRAEQVSDDMYVSIDLVVEVIERQVTKHRKKLIDKEQNVAYLNDAFVDEDVEDDDDIKIVRTKKDLLGHNFYVFRNAESDEVNVVYKRKGGTYGIIEPEY